MSFKYLLVGNGKKNCKLSDILMNKQPLCRNSVGVPLIRKGFNRLKPFTVFSDLDRIQTYNLLIRSQMLYSIELRSHLGRKNNKLFLQSNILEYCTFIKL